jgi:hypothetical protein
MLESGSIFREKSSFSEQLIVPLLVKRATKGAMKGAMKGLMIGMAKRYDK